MKILQVTKKDLNYKDFIKRTAQVTDYDIFIDEPTIVKDENGKIVFIYDEIDIDSSQVVDSIKRIKYTQGKRARGLVSQSRIFGYRPRLAMRADYCSSTSLATESPTEHGVVCDFAEQIEKYYETYHPDGYKMHKDTTDKAIISEYKLGGKSIFTSGIINKNNPLKYHFDTGNFTGVYSCMVVFKGGIEGGFLSMPEYGIGVELKNNSIFMFDGQRILHGVTPIRYSSPAGYRYSIVYYSLKQIWKCLPLNEELARVKNKKTEREKMRHNMTPEHRAMLKARFGKQ